MAEGNIDAKTLRGMLERGERVTVLDMRKAEERFVQKVAGGFSPTPENYERIVALNRSGEQPDGDPMELEAGANRCAAG